MGWSLRADHPVDECRAAGEPVDCTGLDEPSCILDPPLKLPGTVAGDLSGNPGQMGRHVKQTNKQTNRKF